MSLVASASPWIDDNLPKKKRQSTLRIRPPAVTFNDSPAPLENSSFSLSAESVSADTSLSIIGNTKESYQNMQPATFEDIQQSNMNRNRRVDELLDKITSADQDSNPNMGSFKPPENPIVQLRRDTVSVSPPSDGTIGLPSFAEATQKMRSVAAYNFSADDSRLGSHSNYASSYQPPAPIWKGGSGNIIPSHDPKLMEKIHYIIHMLEAQQAERTSNITEEFILYTFLGVFIIYIVDSFAKVGKYTR